MKAKEGTRIERTWIIVVCLGLLFGLNSSASWAAGFAGGTGESGDPYQIATAGQLTSIGSNTNLLAKHFVLVADIDLDPNLPGNKVFDRAVIAPVPEDENILQIPQFTGTLDGLGHRIRGLRIRGEEFVGLFGMLSYEAKVRNLGLENVAITGTYNIGGLAGYSGGSVTDCFCIGSISGKAMYDRVGGLLGQNEGTVSNSFSTGSVSGGIDVGGLVGINGGTITNSYSTAAVSGNDRLGGLIGFFSGGTLRTSLAVGPVAIAAGMKNAGGLVGYGLSSSSIEGFRLDPNDGGGPDNGFGRSLPLTQMQDRASFTGWDFFGDSNDGDRDPWFMPNGSFPVLSFETQVTGLVAVPELSGMSVDRSNAILGWADLASQGAIHTDYHVSITADLVIRAAAHPYVPADSAVGLVVSLGPYNWSKNPGYGTAEQPYQIHSAGQLVSLGQHTEYYGQCFILCSDLDLFDQVFDRALIASNKNDWQEGFSGKTFKGTFDGQGHVIRGLTIAGKNYLGLFGNIDSQAQVRNLAVEYINIIGNQYIGGLAGQNSGTITNCRSTGWVRSEGVMIGGLVGYNWYGILSNCFNKSSISGEGSKVGGLVGHNYSGSILRCQNTGSVRGKNFVGGLLGHSEKNKEISNNSNNGSVSGTDYVGGLMGYTESYFIMSELLSTGSVNGHSYIGGLIGWNNSPIYYSYSTGSVSGTGSYIGGLVGYKTTGVIWRSFWDITTSGQTTSSGGTGLTTDQMQDIQTFLNAGWDFVGETANGTSDLWKMPTSKGYPLLSWQDDTQS